MNQNDIPAPEGTFARLQSMSPGKRAPLSISKPVAKKRTNVRTNDRTNKRSNVGSQDATHYIIHVPTERHKLRRSFDIFKDQQTALDKLQLAAVDAGHKKPKLGDMVQEAIDLYVAEWATKLPNVRVKKRSNE